MISIIVPVYNSENYIKKCLKSLLEQTESNYEIIVIDDGSTDKSKSVCVELQKKSNKIKLYSQDNAGVSNARNYGISQAIGDYVMFVDSDDWIEPDLLISAEKYIKKCSPDVIVYGIKYMEGDKCVYDSSTTKVECFEQNQVKKCIVDLYHTGVIASSVNKVYKKTMLKNIQFDEKLKYGEDLKFNMSVFANVKSIVNMPKAFYFYNRHENSLSTNIDARQIKEMLSLYHESEKFFHNLDIGVQKKNELLERHYFEYLYPYHISLLAKQKNMSMKEKGELIQEILNTDYLKYVKALEKKGVFQKLLMCKNSMIIIGYCKLLSLIQKK